MNKNESVYVSDSISDIIDMDQFYDGKEAIDNISVELDVDGIKTITLLSKVYFDDSYGEIEFICNCSKASQLMFSSEISSVRFIRSTNICFHEMSINVISRSFKLTEDNKYKCKFVVELQ